MCFYIIYVPNRVAYPIIKNVITASATISTADCFYSEEILNGHNGASSKESWRKNNNSLILGRHKNIQSKFIPVLGRSHPETL